MTLGGRAQLAPRGLGASCGPRILSSLVRWHKQQSPAPPSSGSGGGVGGGYNSHCQLKVLLPFSNSPGGGQRGHPLSGWQAVHVADLSDFLGLKLASGRDTPALQHYIRFFGPMPPDASDFPDGLPAWEETPMALYCVVGASSYHPCSLYLNETLSVLDHLSSSIYMAVTLLDGSL